MLARALRTALAAGLAALLFAIASARADAPHDRLALVVGEANYEGQALPTVANDASLVAKSLVADGFAVTELHDLGTRDLIEKYLAFLNDVREAHTGAQVAVYLSGLAVNVGCDDYLLPVDAHIGTPADVTRVSLGMSRLMTDLAETQTRVRLVILDGARPIPSSVSEAAFPRGLMPLDPAADTIFGLAAEPHDFESPPHAGDANDAYATAFAAVSKQPFADLEASMREARISTHRATSGAQTPWHATNPTVPGFALALGADPSLALAASASLPSSSAPLASLDIEGAYWAAIARNTPRDYQAFLDAFSSTAPAELLARAQTLQALLTQPNPECQGSSAPPPPLPAPETLMAEPTCPDGFAPEDGYNGAYCTPLTPPPVLDCPEGFATIANDDGMACAPLFPPAVLVCPPGFYTFPDRVYCTPERPPIFCPREFRPIFHRGEFDCARRGPPPPECSALAHPVWSGGGWNCAHDPPQPTPCKIGRAVFGPGGWGCVAPPPARCAQGQIEYWVDGRSVCRGVRPLPEGVTCPPNFARGGPGGAVCAAAHATPVFGAPSGSPGSLPGGLRCANGAMPPPGQTCRGAPPSGEAICPQGEVNIGGRGCAPPPGAVIAVPSPAANPSPRVRRVEPTAPKSTQTPIVFPPGPRLGQTPVVVPPAPRAPPPVRYVSPPAPRPQPLIQMPPSPRQAPTPQTAKPTARAPCAGAGQTRCVPH